MVDFLVLLFVGVIAYIVFTKPGGATAVKKLNNDTTYYVGALTHV